MGGGFALVTLVGLVQNAKMMMLTFDKSDAQYLRNSGFVLLISLTAVLTGFAIHKFRRWGILLAAGISIVVVGYGAPSLIENPVQPETLTVFIPMVLILFWAGLPATWLQFKKQGAETT